MTSIENVYICLTAPLLIAALCFRGTRKGLTLFLISGGTACLLSSYVSAYLAALLGADPQAASIEIAPFVEELMKFTPMLFYLMALEPKKDRIAERVLMIGVGFATFENVCYLLTNGTAEITHLLIRGFGTGAMHIVCGTIVSIGLIWLWDYRWLRVAGAFGLLAVAITYHGVYNILVSQPGAIAVVGYVIPLFTTVLVILFRNIRIMPEENGKETAD